MSSAEVMATLLEQGLSVRLDDAGKLLVGPAQMITDEARALIQGHREALVEHVRDDGRTAALDEFDTRFPPKFDGTDSPRVLVRCPPGWGRKWLVIHEDVLDAVLRHNAVARLAHEQAAVATETGPAKKKRPSKGPRIVRIPDATRSGY